MPLPLCYARCDPTGPSADWPPSRYLWPLRYARRDGTFHGLAALTLPLTSPLRTGPPDGTFRGLATLPLPLTCPLRAGPPSGIFRGLAALLLLLFCLFTFPATSSFSLSFFPLLLPPSLFLQLPLFPYLFDYFPATSSSLSFYFYYKFFFFSCYLLFCLTFPATTSFSLSCFFPYPATSFFSYFSTYLFISLFL